MKVIHLGILRRLMTFNFLNCIFIKSYYTILAGYVKTPNVGYLIAVFLKNFVSIKNERTATNREKQKKIVHKIRWCDNCEYSCKI